jgi:hypothetical protein
MRLWIMVPPPAIDWISGATAQALTPNAALTSAHPRAACPHRGQTRQRQVIGADFGPTSSVVSARAPDDTIRTLHYPTGEA